jgi:hypothetical protein
MLERESEYASPSVKTDGCRNPNALKALKMLEQESE